MDGACICNYCKLKKSCLNFCRNLWSSGKNEGTLSEHEGTGAKRRKISWENMEQNDDHGWMTDCDPIQYRPTKASWRDYHCEALQIPTSKDMSDRVDCDAMVRPNDMIAMKPDGNCFFRAISYELTGKQKHHAALRTKLVDFMRDNKAKIEEYMGEPLEPYLDDMIIDGTWITEVEVVAMATLLQTAIVLYTHVPGDTKLQFHKHEPLFDRPDVDKFDMKIYLTLIKNHVEQILTSYPSP